VNVLLDGQAVWVGPEVRSRPEEVWVGVRVIVVVVVGLVLLDG
jgi:hypothetical protein